MKSTNDPKMKVLLIEDNPDDAKLIESTLKRVASALFEVLHVPRLDEGVKHLERTSFDLVLLDLSLPDSHGLETLEILNKRVPGVPIVVLTGLDDENVGLEAVRKGAQDFLVKGQLDGNLLSRVMRYARERKWSELQLRQAIVELTQSRQELLQTIAELNKVHAGLKIAQLQLIEAAKMESVGRLAAGIAHEVKSPLATVVLGVDYLVTHQTGSDQRTQQILKNMAEAVTRADDVISQLQEFSDPSDLEVKVENLNEVAKQSLVLMKHELTAHNINVEQELGQELRPLWIDPTKMQQALVNVLMNAVEAMPQGGTVRVRTSTTQLAADEVPVVPPGDTGSRFQPGNYVVVAEIEDSGTGIAGDNIRKAFDPFFTTKPDGKGTGLGLTVAKKIIEMHGGRIDLANRDGGGLRVKMMFAA